MPSRSARGEASPGSAGAGRKRYAATVMKGDNAWRSEWGSFMSGINLKRVRDGTSGVALRAAQDLAHLAPSYDSDDEKQERHGGDVRSPHGERADGDEEDDMGGAVATYAYLFNSPAERRAEREAKQRAHEEEMRRRRKERSGNPLDLLSKHQRSLAEAQERGLALDGMSRKEKREFLHLTVSKAQQEAAEAAKAFKLHDLMDEKIAWYQQGPHPIDLIAEKLVSRKAEKKAKQLNLKYNYLRPHPSWMAKRAQHRRERLLVGLGRRFVFDEEGRAMDPLRNNALVDLTKVSWSLIDRQEADPTQEADETAAGGVVTRAAIAESGEKSARPAQDEGTEGSSGATGTAASPNLPSGSPPPRSVLTNILVDPLAAQNRYVRAVVRDRQAALALQKANLSTTFLSSHLVRDPKEAPPGARDDEDGVGGDARGDRRVSGRGGRGGKEAANRKTRSSAPSAKRGPSFSTSADAATAHTAVEVKKWEKKLANKAKKMD